MKIELKPGEKIEVTFFETDGLISVEYGAGDKGKKEAGFIKVYSDLPDSTNREGVIYFEQCNQSDCNCIDLNHIVKCPGCGAEDFTSTVDSETDYTEYECHNCNCIWREYDKDPNVINIFRIGTQIPR